MAQNTANPWDRVITNEQAKLLSGRVLKKLRGIVSLEQSRDLIEPYEVAGSCVGFIDGGPTTRPRLFLTNDGLQVWWYINGDVDLCLEAIDKEPSEDLLRRVIQVNQITPATIEELKGLLVA